MIARGPAHFQIVQAGNKETVAAARRPPPAIRPLATAMNDLAWFWCVAASVKLVLVPAYHSTDFEVHRHWLALTSSLPLSRWYTDTSSPWTLDYPPLFAYFEYLLSLPAALVDPTIVDIDAGQGYAAPSVILFQRLTVSLSVLVLLFGVHRFTRRLGLSQRRAVLALVLWSPALLIVDHIHFQYNGFLLGILLISLSFLAEGRDLAGGIVFAVLICFKHLFMVAAPVYFVYILRHYCRGGLVKGLMRLALMGAAVGMVFAASFGPFVYYGQIQQVARRLFPFGRGLYHAYWAPNLWVFYIILDKVLALVLGNLGFTIQAPKASFTGGLVGDSSPFAVLPQVTPIITFLLVLLAMSPCLVKAFQGPQPKHIVRWVAYAYTCGFIFGWHVHEKASLHFIIPLGLIAMSSSDDAGHYFLLSIVSCYSMFPLLFEPQEYPIKVLLLAVHVAIMWASFSSHFSKSVNSGGAKKRDPKGLVKENGIIGWVGICYLLGLLAVETWGQFLHAYIFGSRLPFVPLILVSIYCAVGMVYSWAWQLRQIIRCS